jgi:hypothetical protein
MNLEELEEALEQILPVGFQIVTDDHGQVVIYTNLMEDEDADGELVDFEGGDDEEDLDVDPDFEPLEDEEDDED